MTPSTTSELSAALGAIRPYHQKVAFFSLVTALLSLAPTVYMFQVYDRVVNSRNLLTLLMLTIMVIGVLRADSPTHTDRPTQRRHQLS